MYSLKDNLCFPYSNTCKASLEIYCTGSGHILKAIMIKICFRLSCYEILSGSGHSKIPQKEEAAEISMPPLLQFDVSRAEFFYVLWRSPPNIIKFHNQDFESCPNGYFYLLN